MATHFSASTSPIGQLPDLMFPCRSFRPAQLCSIVIEAWVTVWRPGDATQMAANRGGAGGTMETRKEHRVDYGQGDAAGFPDYCYVYWLFFFREGDLTLVARSYDHES